VVNHDDENSVDVERRIALGERLARIETRLGAIEDHLLSFARCPHQRKDGSCELGEKVYELKEWAWQAKGVMIAVGFLSTLFGGAIAAMIVKLWSDK